MSKDDDVLGSASALRAARRAATDGLAAVVDPDGNTLWIHLRCGETQWSDADAPEWCNTCSFRTDAWRQLYIDARVGVRRERPRPFGEVS